MKEGNPKGRDNFCPCRQFASASRDNFLKLVGVFPRVMYFAILLNKCTIKWSGGGGEGYGVYLRPYSPKSSVLSSDNVVVGKRGKGEQIKHLLYFVLKICLINNN